MGSGGRDDVKAKALGSDSKWIESIVVRQRNIARGGDGGDDRKGVSADLLQDHRYHKQASLEIPLQLSDADRLSVETDRVNVSMSCYMPPACVDGPWSGTIEGRSTFGGGSSSPGSSTVDGTAKEADGSLTLQYKSSTWSQLSLGAMNGSGIHYPLLMVGGTLLIPKKQTAVGVTFYQNPSFLHPSLWKHSMVSLSLRHRIPNTSWRVSSQLSRRQQLHASASNGKVHGSISWNLRSLNSRDGMRLPSFQISLRPTVSAHRRAILYVSVSPTSPAMWQVGASLLQQLHAPVASIGVGFRFLSARGLEWVLAIHRGEATVRIPILLARTLWAKATLGQALYMSMVSFFLQEAIADIWGWTKLRAEVSSRGAEGDLPTSSSALSSSSPQHDAELQRQVMVRQAIRKTRDERECNGLVIQKATYQVKGGNAVDVTTPLQFWVVRSTLTLPAVSKATLLGFYDVTTTIRNDGEHLESAKAGKLSIWKNMWSDLWESSISLNSEKLKPVPTLTVCYQYKGRPYQVTIRDDDLLSLPAVHATPLDKDSSNVDSKV